MVAQIAGCDPADAARSLEQADGEIKTAVLLALGIDRSGAETLLRQFDGNLRRVFAELAKDRYEPHKAGAPRRQGGAVEP